MLPGARNSSIDVVAGVKDHFTLVPAAGKNIVEVAKGDKDLDNFVKFLENANGFIETLAGNGPFTVFAPTNKPIESLPISVLAHLQSQADVEKLLKYHVVAGKALSSDLHNLETIKTLEGASVKVHIQGSKVGINNATVLQANMLASNGVVHVIDKVLVPPDFLAEMV